MPLADGFAIGVAGAGLIVPTHAICAGDGQGQRAIGIGDGVIGVVGLLACDGSRKLDGQALDGVA